MSMNCFIVIKIYGSNVLVYVHESFFLRMYVYSWVNARFLLWDWMDSLLKLLNGCLTARVRVNRPNSHNYINVAIQKTWTAMNRLTIQEFHVRIAGDPDNEGGSLGLQVQYRGRDDVLWSCWLTSFSWIELCQGFRTIEIPLMLKIPTEGHNSHLSRF